MDLRGWIDRASFPLTLSLSLGDREKLILFSFADSALGRLEQSERIREYRKAFPLSEGEGKLRTSPAAILKFFRSVTCPLLLLAALLFSLNSAFSQPRPSRPLTVPASTGGYSSNLVVIREAQQRAIEQAREMLGEVENDRDRASLQAAIKEMERSQEALEAAEKSPEKLAAATAAQQNAYQALLKLMPREYRMQRSRQNQGQSGQSGQPQRQQMEQLEMNREEDRYETERQARAEPNQQQREQLQTADRLRELAQRQQDLNERLRELQTALQAARTEPEREELRRQLKRLQEEQRQMVADTDQLRQQMEQSSNATPESREQMDQARSDMQRAAQELENGSPSGALAAGSRAQQNMQNMRDDLRRQTSSQFTEQMRDLRNDARELTRRQEEIARGLDQLENGRERTLDTSRERQELVRQMAQQRSALTNLLSEMRAVTEQAETTEPLLSKQLYDTLRRADQARTEELMRMGAQLTDRGFLPQAGEAERTIRQNLNDIRQSVERAAESVLGNEAESLRYAERELDRLTNEIQRELSGTERTNGLAAAGGRRPSAASLTNQLAQASQDGRQGGNQSQAQSGERAGQQSNEQAGGEGAQQGQQGEPGEEGQGGQQGQPAQSDSRSQTAQAGQASGEQRGEGQGQRQGQGQGQGQREGNQTAQNGRGEQPQEGDQPGQSEGRPGSERQASGGGQRGGRGATGGDDGGYRLRQIVEQLGNSSGGGLDGGPITGGGFVDWSDRLRDVERVLDDPELRNELASVRERVAALRAEFRESGRRPSGEVLKHNIVTPLSDVRVWLRQELARRDNPSGLVPLDRDPVPENFSELVRKYYENLGTAQ